MTAMQLLKDSNSELIAMLDTWSVNREPPIPLSDWFRDREMEDQADCVMWVLKKGIKREFRSDIESYLFPLASKDINLTVYAWIIKTCFNKSYSDYTDVIFIIDSGNFIDKFIEYKTINEALCYLLDIYPHLYKNV